VHPIFSHRLRLVLYLAAWTVAGFAFAAKMGVFLARSVPEALIYGVPTAVFYGLVCLSAWWVCRATPLGATPWQRVLGMQLGAALLASALWALVASAWWTASLQITAHMGVPAGPAVPGGVAPPPLPRLPFLPGLDALELRRLVTAIVFVAGIPLYLLSAVVHYLVLTFEAAREAERRALESRVVARDAELRALRAQLNPHFLFNSLNSISALVGRDPQGARRMCERLGDFLRQTLALAARESVPLADELALIERYLEIERVRFGERLGADVNVPEEAARCQVPPLLLQPLVENAVKHGVAARIEGGTVHIRAERAGGRLLVTVENPCDEESSNRGQGLGLENVRRRMFALDPRGARLNAGLHDGVFRVALDLAAVESAAGNGGAVAFGAAGPPARGAADPGVRVAEAAGEPPAPGAAEAR
jgi:two-component system sensor histidine kinase AlgZ